MIQVTEELTRKVANLARLELSDAEVEKFTPQIEQILKYVDQLAEVSIVKADGSEVEPLLHSLEFAAPMRADQIRPSLIDEDGKPKILASAPEVVNDGFKVPPIL